MNANYFLSRALYSDARIKDKIEQIQTLRDMSVSCTQAITGMPHNPSGSKRQMADAVDMLVDLEDDLNWDLKELVNTRREIRTAIREVEDIALQTVLEMRYLNGLSWTEIENRLGKGHRWTMELHRRAVSAIQNILDEKS